VASVRWDEGTAPAMAPVAGRLLSLTADRRVALVSSDRGMVDLVDTSTGLHRRMLGAAASAVFPPDGSRIVTASRTGDVALWDGHTGARMTFLDGSASAGFLFSPDAHRLLVGGLDEGRSELRDGRDGRLVATLSTGPFSEVAGDVARVEGLFSPDGSLLVTWVAGSLSRGAPDQVRLWSADDGRFLYQTQARRVFGVQGLAFFPDSHRLAIAQRASPAVAVLDGRSGASIAELPAEGTVALTFDPGGDLVATAATDATTVWDWRTQRVLARLAPSVPPWLRPVPDPREVPVLTPVATFLAFSREATCWLSADRARAS
jgi:WD40 repeat protein